MEQVIKILEEIKPGVDYSVETDLIGDKILDSLKIVQLVSELNDEFDIEKSINYHKQVLEYDKKEFKANVEETIDNVAKDIVDNYSKYKEQSLFEVMPILVSKYMKTHNDSVEHKAYVLYLNNSLKKYGKYLPTTNLIDLRNI